MECLIDYIGLRACGNETPASGLFINSLPGISLESVDKIADSEQISYTRVWADAQAEAAATFYVDFVSAVSECYALNPYCDYEAMICANKLKLAQAWRFLLGVKLMEFRIYSTRLNRFTTIDLEAAKELRDHYQVEYDKFLKQAARLVDVSSCELCCGGNPETVIWLP
jgi:hypothetical protein